MILAQQAVVPALDPIGLPAQPAWFVFLLVLTMLLHVLFMNFVLGGSVLALGLNVAAVFKRAGTNRTATIIYQMMPAALSLAITMGVAPLLFVQVLYGPYFYSSNVLLGFTWLAFFIVVMAAFYLSYWLTLRGSNALQGRVGRWDDKPVRRLLVGGLATAGFVWVAWTLTNNHELSIRPALWAADGAWRSPRLYVSAPTTIARFLHDVVGATAVAGVWVAAVGWWRIRRIPGEREENVRLIRFGLFAAAAVSAVQVVVGLFFFMLLESDVRWSLMGFGSALGAVWTVLLPVAIALPLLLGWAALQPDRFRWFALSAGATAVVLVGMLLGREHVRLTLLGAPEAGSFTLDKWAVYPQPLSLIVFLVLLVIGLGVVGLMLKWVTDRRDPATDEPSAPPA